MADGKRAARGVENVLPLGYPDRERRAACGWRSEDLRMSIDAVDVRKRLQGGSCQERPINPTQVGVMRALELQDRRRTMQQCPIPVAGEHGRISAGISAQADPSRSGDFVSAMPIDRDLRLMNWSHVAEDQRDIREPALFGSLA